MLSVTSGVLLYIIYQNRISGRRIDSLRETELATRITAEDVGNVVLKSSVMASSRTTVLCCVED